MVLTFILLLNFSVYCDDNPSSKKESTTTIQKENETEKKVPESTEYKAQVYKDIQRIFFPLYSYKYNEKKEEKSMMIIPLLSGSNEYYDKKGETQFQIKYSIPFLSFYSKMEAANVSGHPAGKIFFSFPIMTFYANYQYAGMNGSAFNSLLFLSTFTRYNECKYYAFIPLPIITPVIELRKIQPHDIIQYLEKVKEKGEDSDRVEPFNQITPFIFESLTGIENGQAKIDEFESYLKGEKDYKLCSILYPFISRYKSADKKRFEVLPLFSSSKENDIKHFTLIPLLTSWSSDKGLKIEPKALLKWWPLINYDKYLNRTDILWPLGDCEKIGNIERKINFDLLYKRNKTSSMDIHNFGPFGILGHYKKRENITKCNVLTLIFDYYKDTRYREKYSILYPIYYYSKSWGKRTQKTKSLFPLFTYHEHELKSDPSTKRKFTIIWALLSKYGEDNKGKYIQPFFLFKIRY